MQPIGTEHNIIVRSVYARAESVAGLYIVVYIHTARVCRIKKRDDERDAGNCVARLNTRERKRRVSAVLFECADCDADKLTRRARRVKLQPAGCSD